MPSKHLFALLAAASLLWAPTACEKKQEVAAAAPPEVVVAPVEKKDVEITSEWVGTTTGFVNAQIFPKIQGYLMKQDYTDGTEVKQGQLLFEIDPRQYQAALDQAKGLLERARAALGKAELDVKRYTPLAAEGAVSQQELDDAIQARAAGKAQVASAQAAFEDARLNLEWTSVKSPIDGIAGIAKAQVGDLVGPQTLLTDVSQVDPIKVEFPISEIDYLRFSKRQQEREKAGGASEREGLQLILADGSVYPHLGKLSVAGLSVARTTGTIPVRAVFPNPDNLLRPGQFAKVRAVTDRIPGALVIPQRAVRDLQGTSQVALVASDDKVTFHNIELGPTTGSDVVVSQGLEPGQRIVVEGLQKIREGALVKPVPASTGNAAGAPAPKPEAAGK